MPSRADDLRLKDCVCLNERERETILIYVFVRNERDFVFLCTKDLMMLTANSTLQALMGCGGNHSAVSFG